MKKSKKVIILAFLMLIVLGGAGAVLAADNGKWLGGNRGARQEQMKTIIENNDYNQWKQLMGNRGVTQKINEQNFSKFVEMHKLMTAGKLDEANVIKQELGLGQGKGMNGKRGGGCGGGCTGANGSGFVDANKDGVCDHTQ